MEIIGLLAGDGDLPVIFLERAKEEANRKFLTVAFKRHYSSKVKDLSDNFYTLSVANSIDSIDIFSKFKVSQVALLGKMDKSLYLQTTHFGRNTEAFIKELRSSTDFSIFSLFKKKLEGCGISVMNTRKYFHQESVESGVLTSRWPSPEEERDINYGIEIGKKLTEVGIGQTVVVRGESTCAVEAIEGTDNAILRGGKHGGKGTVVVKIANPGYESFDISVVGYGTLKVLVEVEATCLAIEARKIYILEKDKVIKEANNHGIAIKAIEVRRR